jgi:hypothetical protein
VLHLTADRYASALLESNCTHARSFIRVRHEFCIIFSNAEDETWTQDKHLQHLGNVENAEVCTIFYGYKLVEMIQGSDVDIGHK